MVFGIHKKIFLYSANYAKESEVEQRRLRIAFLIDTITCDTAGTQRQLLETIRRLDRATFSPQLICLYSSPWMQQNELPCPVTVLGYRGFLKPNFPKVLLALRRLVWQQPIHLLQTFFEDSIFVAFLATLGLGRSRCRLLSSRRDMGLGRNRPWYHLLFSLALPLVSRRFDGLVCNGEEIRKWVARKERVPLEKIRVISNGTLLPGSSAAAPDLFSRHPSSLWLGLVASLTPVKRIDLFLMALKLLTERRSELAIQALVLGEGPERETLLALASSLGVADRVHFLGTVRDVSPFLQLLDIGVLTSDREGFSNAVLEYMAHALPVVVTAVGGNLELVDPTVGICVPAGDSEALAEALLRLGENSALRKRLGTAGREKVKDRYSWKRSMAELEGYYTQLLAARATRSGHPLRERE